MAYIYGTTTYAKDSNGNYITSNGKYVYQVRLGYQVNSQDVTLNQSNISLRLEVRSVNSNFKTYGYDQQTTIDGTFLGVHSFDFRSTNVWQVFGTKTFDVTHDSDGKYNATKSGNFLTNAGGTGRPYSGSASVEVSLPTIARASDIIITTVGRIEYPLDIGIGKRNVNYTTTLQYKIDGQDSWTNIVEKTSTSLYTWTIPSSFYSYVPTNAKSVNCEFKAITYNGDTSIGETTKTIECTMDKPPIINSYSVVDTNATTTALTGDSSKIVLNVSNVQITANVSGQYNATISSMTTNDVAMTLSGTNPTTGTLTINKCTISSFVINITDSRGFVSTQNHTSQTINYIPLTISATIKRHQPTDNQVDISFSGNYWSGDFGSQTNTLTVQYRYKESTSSTWGNWTSITPTITNNTYSGGTGNSPLTGIDYQKIYNFEIRATDKVGTKTITGITITKGKPVYWWNDDEFDVNTNLYGAKAVFSNGKRSSADGNSGVALLSGGVEISSATPFIDFHFNNSTSDYTSRIIETSSGVLSVTGGLTVIGELKTNGLFRTQRTIKFSRDALETGVSGRYYKIASLPASSDTNAQFLTIKGSIGNWSTYKATIEILISNRNDLLVYGTLLGNTSALNSQRVVIYQESNNTHSVYLYCVTNYCSPNTFEFTWGKYSSGTTPTIYTDNSYTTSPTGTLKWTSSTSNVICLNTTISGSSVVTRTSGATLNSSEYRRFGNVVQLTIVITSSGTTNTGSNAFVGQISDSNLIPKIPINSSSYNGSTALNCFIDASGNITCRVLASNLGSGKEMTVGFTYVI